jgi:hypothetical protein
VTEKEVSADPPVLEPAVMFAAPLLYGRPVPTLAAVTVGACGTVVAVIEFNDVADEVPLAFVAVKLKVYAVAEARPPMVIEEDPDPVRAPDVAV